MSPSARPLHDHVVVITGAGGGIGAAVAGSFASAGAHLVLADLDAAWITLESAAAVARGLGVRATTATGDVARATDMTALARLAVDEHGRLDVLVTCAGIDGQGLLAEQDEATWTRVIDVNLNGTYRAIRAALPQMMAQGRGRIITVSSVLGKFGGYGFVSAYVASKHGVIGLTRALATELGSQGYAGITVNAICPGYVRAGMGVKTQSTKSGPVSGAQVFERFYKRLTPLRRMVEPDEIGQAAVFLALPGSGAITGQALNVDGGFFQS